MSRNPKLILTIEDDTSMREIIAHKLLSSGFSVLEAGDGREGLTKWESKKPGLVLLDLMLPELDGFEVLKTIRDSQDLDIAKTPVIVLSNIFNKEDMERIKLMHVDEFLIKAYFTTEEIMDKVKQVLKEYY